MDVLLQGELAHVLRCVNLVLDVNCLSAELLFRHALGLAIKVYTEDRKTRKVANDPSILRLEEHAAINPVFPCGVSEKLFTLNFQVLSLLCSRDPLLRKAHDCLSHMIASGGGACGVRNVDGGGLVCAGAAAAVNDFSCSTSFLQQYNMQLKPHVDEEDWICILGLKFVDAACWAAFVSCRNVWEGKVCTTTSWPPECLAAITPELKTGSKEPSRHLHHEYYRPIFVLPHHVM